ncbi:MAG TPA: hypothetical protein DIU15_16035 [Deltaproteobacteria bacterium]|nr:hypothetical protein [Deltaproteobacteria bacterium]HCP47551.1 hypothetical protein [Deltaproteobacteria bacterium]
MVQASLRRVRLFLAPSVARSALVGAFFLLTSVSCSQSASEAPEPSEPVVQRVPVDPLTAGAIEGVVRFTGEVPKRTAIKMGRVAACANHSQEPAYYDRLLASQGLLQNAFVTIVEGLEAYEFPPPTGAVEVDQLGCVYSPRVSAVRAGQDVTFINSDPTNHNVHTVSKANRGMNFSMPSQGMRTTKIFKKPEIMVRVKCDIHPWMGGWIGVQRHPHMAVTGRDGAFRFEGVPPGTYKVLAWHETLGTQETTVELAPRASGRAVFSFDAD